MKGTRNIFLVGLMGAGKTTVGRQLARALNLRFEDSDRVIEARCGTNISTIFAQEGEANFRAWEKMVVHELTAEDGIVLATGGGVVLDMDNRANLKARGYVIYLRAPVEVLVARTSHDRGRPLLQDTNPHLRLNQLYKIRDPLYREVADLIMDTNNRGIRVVVKELLRRLDRRALLPSNPLPPT